MILAVAGTQAFGYVFPISIAIVLLLTIVSISYEQIIHAYPDGGGAYIVARDNIGRFGCIDCGIIAFDGLYSHCFGIYFLRGGADCLGFSRIYEYRVVYCGGGCECSLC